LGPRVLLFENRNIFLGEDAPRLQASKLSNTNNIPFFLLSLFAKRSNTSISVVEEKIKNEKM
jgi:hypothetical protein